ncbi:MAG TPA: hypothetical protein VEZ90_15875 [Blastocatellia bacterium]|nr:hypothetical protein [Blastocatellia bacterium]
MNLVGKLLSGDASRRSCILRSCVIKTLGSATLTVLCCSGWAVAQTPSTIQAVPGKISGKVTLAGKPAPGIKVVLLAEDPTNRGQNSANVAARSATDEGGLYSFADVAAGHYWVVPLAPADVLPGGQMGYEEGKSVLLDNGEEASGVDISLLPGGVITGRIVDSSNQPLIGQRIALEKLADDGSTSPYWSIRMFNIVTDDRGIYRAYGLPSGRYKVSIGDQSVAGQARHYARTYSPGVTDPSLANVVEVQQGTESPNVDVTLGAGSRTYSASGRIIESDSGLAVPYLSLLYGRTAVGGYSSTSSGQSADARGQFTLPGLAPGHYQVSVSPNDPTGYVAEPTGFDVADSDVTGVEIKVTRGATVSGTVTIDGSADQTTAPSLSNVSLMAIVIPNANQPGMTGFRTVNPGADGTFQVTGMSAGMLQLQLGNGQQSGLRISRVELNGAVPPNGQIEVGSGQQVTGVNVILSYGTGSIRGSVNLTGVAVPEGAMLWVSGRNLSADSKAQGVGAQLDSVGHFEIDSLADGDYEISVIGFVRGQGLLSLKYSKPTASIVGGQTANVSIQVENLGIAQRPQSIH